MHQSGHTAFYLAGSLFDDQSSSDESCTGAPLTEGPGEKFPSNRERRALRKQAAIATPEVSVPVQPATPPPEGAVARAARTVAIGPTSAFEISSRHLNVSEELAALVGTDASDAGRARNGHGRRLMQWLGGSRCVLVKPRDTWPKVGGGLGMEREGRENGGAFTFTHSRSYREVSAQLDAVAGASDARGLHALVNANPCHVESLLALAELLLLTGDAERSAEMVERALHVCEACAHHAFRLDGTCRLYWCETPRAHRAHRARCTPVPHVDHRRRSNGVMVARRSAPANRAFVRALGLHMHAASRRGCHRAALELAKLIYTLDPEEVTRN